MDEPEIKRRCKAMLSSRRRRCRKSAMLGQEVCDRHGGRAPAAKRKARERLDSLVEPAVRALEEALKAGKTSDVIRAAEAVLDRCRGFQKGGALDVEVSGSVDVQTTFPVEALPAELQVALLAAVEGKPLPPGLRASLLEYAELPPAIEVESKLLPAPQPESEERWHVL